MSKELENCCGTTCNRQKLIADFKEVSSELNKQLNVLQKICELLDVHYVHEIPDIIDKLKSNSNDILAKRIADLDRQRSELLKVVEHIALAVNCENDKMSCWESVDVIIAEHKLLKDTLLKITYKNKSGNGIFNLYIEDTDLSKFEGVQLAYKD